MLAFSNFESYHWGNFNIKKKKKMDNQQDNPPIQNTNPVNPGGPSFDPSAQPVTPPQPQPQYVPQPEQPAQQPMPQYAPETQPVAQPVQVSMPPSPSMTAAYPVDYPVPPQSEGPAVQQAQNNLGAPNTWPEQASQPPYDAGQQQIAPASPGLQQPVTQPAVQQGPSAPEKYKIVKSVADTIKAAKNNIVTLLVTGFIAYVAAVILITVIALVMIKLFISRLNIFSLSGGVVIGGLIGGLVLYTLWYAFAYAFILAVTSISLRDGAQKRKGTIGGTLKSGLGLIKRVALANTLVALVVIWPIAIISFLPLLLLSSGGRTGAAIFSLIAGVVAVVWAIIGSLRYSLVPYVAIFEPDVPIKKTLGRSKELLKKGGQWFIVKGFLLILLIGGILGAMTGKNLQELNSANNIGVNIIFVIVSAIASGSLAMLYLNRKAVKG